MVMNSRLNVNQYWCNFTISVTTVDSGSKALEFLGLHEEDDEIHNMNQPSVSPNINQVCIWRILDWIFYVIDCFGKDLPTNLQLYFAGSGNQSDNYWLLYAWNDRLWFAQKS